MLSIYKTILDLNFLLMQMVELNLILSFFEEGTCLRAHLFYEHRIRLTTCDYFYEMKEAFSFQGFIPF